MNLAFSQLEVQLQAQIFFICEKMMLIGIWIVVVAVVKPTELI